MLSPNAKSPWMILVTPCEVSPDTIQKLSGKLFFSHAIPAQFTSKALSKDKLTLLHKGSRTDLERIQLELSSFGLKSWVLPHNPPAFKPRLVKKISYEKNRVIFSCKDGLKEVSASNNILGILTDISGKKPAQYAQNKAIQAARSGEKEPEESFYNGLYPAIFSGRPVLDLYIYDEGPPEVLRLISRAHVSGKSQGQPNPTSKPIHTLLQHFFTIKAPVLLNLDFGIADIPGCNLSSSDTSDALLDNLSRLSRFGDILMVMAETDSKPPSHISFLPLSTGFEALGHEKPAETPQKLPPASQPATPVLDIGNTDLPPPPPHTHQRTSNPRIKLYVAVGIITGIIVSQKIFGDVISRILTSPAVQWINGYMIVRGGLFAVIAPVLFYIGFRAIHRKRLIEDLPTSRIRSMAMGLVELKGFATRRYNLISPVTLTPCIYYKIDKYRQKNGNENWECYASATSDAVPFYLTDETGQVTIDPYGAIYKGVRKDTYHGNIMIPTIGSALVIPGGEKWVEELIPERSPLYVLGWAEPESPAENPIKEKLMAQLRQIKKSPAAMAKYDTNGDGHIDTLEWDQAREAITDKLYQEQLTGPRQSSAGNTVVECPPERGMPMIISPTREESKLTKKYFLISIASMAGGLISVVLAATLMLP